MYEPVEIQVSVENTTYAHFRHNDLKLSKSLSQTKFDQF